MWMYMRVCSSTCGGQRFLAVVFMVTFHLGCLREPEDHRFARLTSQLATGILRPYFPGLRDNTGLPYPRVLLRGCHGCKLQSSHSRSPARHPLNHRPSFSKWFLFAKFYLLVNFVIRFLQKCISSWAHTGLYMFDSIHLVHFLEDTTQDTQSCCLSRASHPEGKVWNQHKPVLHME